MVNEELITVLAKEPVLPTLFCDAGDGNQVLALAKPTLYH